MGQEPAADAKRGCPAKPSALHAMQKALPQLRYNKRTNPLTDIRKTTSFADNLTSGTSPTAAHSQIPHATLIQQKYVQYPCVVSNDKNSAPIVLYHLKVMPRPDRFLPHANNYAPYRTKFVVLAMKNNESPSAASTT